MAKTFNSVLTATFMALQLTSADEATSRLQDSIWKKIWDYKSFFKKSGTHVRP